MDFDLERKERSSGASADLATCSSAAPFGGEITRQVRGLCSSTEHGYERPLFTKQRLAQRRAPPSPQESTRMVEEEAGKGCCSKETALGNPATPPSTESNSGVVKVRNYGLGR